MRALRSGSAHGRPRGFTLIEMMVGLAVTTIILLSVAASFTAVQGSYQAETRIKSSTEGARTALGFIEKQLKLAGYGIDPRFTFDMDGTNVPSNLKNNYEFSVGANGEWPRVVTDDLAYRFRDPSYLKRGSLSGTTISLESPPVDQTGKFGVPLKAGQALMVSCIGGQEYVVVRVRAAVTADATAAEVTAPVTPFPTSKPGCLALTGVQTPYVMLIHERRLRVVDVDGTPYLVAFRNFDPTAGNTEYDPIAEGVENFQVSYVMARPSPSSAFAGMDPPDKLGNGNWILGDFPGEPGPDFGAAPVPTYRLPYDDISRYSPHPANVRVIRMSVGMRSAQPEPNARRAFEERDVEDALVTTSPGAPPDGYYRTVMNSAVRIPNMLSRSMFTPALRLSAGDPAELNTWGG